MSRTTCWLRVLFFAALITSCVAQKSGPGSVNPETSIPANSENALEFRGQVGLTYEPYEALFQTNTYGELRVALEDFFRQWKADGRTFEDSASTNIFLRCRLALIRTYYLLGDIEKADALLLWMHPATLLDETGFPAGR